MGNVMTAFSTALLILACGLTSAWPDDIMAPPWRGKARTTFQSWTFDDDDNPALPEDVANPWGDPLAHISVVDYFGDVPWERHSAAREWYARVKSRPSFRSLLKDRVAGMPPPDAYADLDF